MRHTIIITALVAIAATVAIWGATAIVANPQKASTRVPAASSIDAMQMMRNAKELPEQSYDAH